MPQTCGFIALGQMGAPMAAHLLKGGRLTVVGRRPEQVAEFEKLGAQVVADPGDLTGCDTVFLCLPDGAIVEEVIFGASGLANVLPRDAIIVDTSTVEYQRTLVIGSRLHERGITFVDAPISGMQCRAEAGTLTMMCGGQPEVIDFVRPLCARFGAPRIPTHARRAQTRISRALCPHRAAGSRTL